MSSYVTLFSVMVVNNWYSICLIYEDVSGYVWVVRVYFLLFYYIGVLIGYNVLVAFAIDIYSSVKRLSDKQWVKEKKDRKKFLKMKAWLQSLDKTSVQSHISAVESQILHSKVS
jgi:hypothetical protein